MIFIVWKDSSGKKEIMGTYQNLERAKVVREELSRGSTHCSAGFYIERRTIG